MRRLFLAIILLALYPVAFSQLRIFSFEAKLHVGDSVRADGITSFTEYKAKDKATYVYFGNKPPLQDLTVMIADADLHNFPEPIKKLFTNKISVVIGKVVLIRNKPTIIVHSFNEFAPGPGQ